MNQILFTKDDYYNFRKAMNFKKRKKNYFIVLSISIIICTIILFYLLYSFFSRLAQKKKNDFLKRIYISSNSNLNTSTGSNSNSNSNSNLNNHTAIKLSDTISIIGLIDIPKIDISYPILSNSNKDLLKISVCRFEGPLPNKNGNMCIAGHNYRNNMMFSKLFKLNINDSIFISDLNNTRKEYIIYDKFKVKENNINCIQNTIEPEITLITCNYNNNSERIVVKAKMKGL